MHYLDSHLHHVDTLIRSVKREYSTYIAMVLINQLRIYTSGVSYAPYAYGYTICVYVYGMYHTRMVQNIFNTVDAFWHL